MAQCQFLFSVVFGSRKADRAMSSEFDESKDKPLISPRRTQNTEGEAERRPTASRPYWGAA
jgi:hypothetical protein